MTDAHVAVPPMAPELLVRARATKGFMPHDEGLALYSAGTTAGLTGLGPLLEIGSYCGKSAVYLGAAARAGATVLFTIDHHRGSEENQSGWDHHDPSLVDSRTGRMDTLPVFRRAIEDAGLEAVVIAVVGDSATVARHWHTPLSFLFIDGGHGMAPAWADYTGWVPHVAIGGLVAIHDVFPDPAEGGQAPFELWSRAVVSGGFVPDEGASCASLRVLRRVSDRF